MVMWSGRGYRSGYHDVESRRKMRHRIFRSIDIASILLTCWLLAALVPAQWFGFWPGSLFIADATPDRAPAILFTRSINRSVRMEYQVVIRELNERRVVCDPQNGPFTYRPDATLPRDVDLVWWTGGDDRCWPQEPGTYIAETCWTVVRPFYGLVPPKTMCIESNPFTVALRLEG